MVVGLFVCMRVSVCVCVVSVYSIINYCMDFWANLKTSWEGAVQKCNVRERERKETIVYANSLVKWP